MVCYNKIMPDVNPPYNMRKPLGKYFLPLVVLVVVSLALVAGYFYRRSISYQSSNSTVQKEVKAMTDKVSKLVILPEGETPTIATVSDPALLKGQVFFAEAEKGDVVLIYTNAKKAILYRPSVNKIVNISSVNLGSAAKQMPAPQNTEIKLPSEGTPNEF